MKEQSIIARIAALKSATTPELKKMWKDLFENDSPAFNRNYLESRLAYRIQELAYGGFSPSTRKRIEELAKTGYAPQHGKDSVISAGTMLVREWRGTEYRVKALGVGFEYGGKRYRSLSRIAREITGTNWNGPLFFGLRRKVK